MKMLSKVVAALLMLGAVKAATPSLSGTNIGWSGAGGDLTGVKPEITDIWTGIASWKDVAAAGWPYANPEFTSFVTDHPTAAANFATALIPHGLPSSQWNSLLDEVIAGQHDEVYQQQGQCMAKYGTTTVYCRPWWEMTNDAKPIDPARFIAAWNHAVPLIRSAFAAAAPNRTLKIVFCYLPNTSSQVPFYPDDSNVDVIDADIYASVWGSTTPSLATLLSQVNLNLHDLAVFADLHHKPVGISEWGSFAVQSQGVTCSQGRGDVPEYLDTMFAFAAQHHFLYMVFYNIAADGPNQTFADTPLMLARFKAAIASQNQAAFLPFAAGPTSYFTSAQVSDTDR